MSRNSNENRLSGTFSSWLEPKALALLFLGFSAGIPILLIFSTLSVWLREAEISRSAVTFFSWAALGYSFKFLWAPLIDLVPFPVLTRYLGRRRGWLLVSQFLVIIAICWMASVNPVAGSSHIVLMACAAVMLGFSSATQDMVIDAYRIECVEESKQALLASTYIAGYRGGMVVAGAGSLFLAGYLGTSMDLYNYSAWRITYFAMAAVMGIGVVTTLVIDEKENSELAKRYEYSTRDYTGFLIFFLVCVVSFALSFFYIGPLVESVLENSVGSEAASGKLVVFLSEVFRFFFAVACAILVGYLFSVTGKINREMVKQSYIEPVREFFSRYSGRAALLLILLVGFYRLSDIVLGVVANVFYLDMGFSKNIIAGVSKSFGLVMTLLGGFFGGVLTLRFGVINILFLGGLLSSATNLLFMLLAKTGSDVTMLTMVIGADNLSAGIAMTAFVAFLSSLTSISFTAVQYAIFSSLMTLFPKLIAGYSGSMVTGVGYSSFFLLTSVMGIPVLALIWMIKRSGFGQQ